jgi:hypothetical protein
MIKENINTIRTVDSRKQVAKNTVFKNKNVLITALNYL